jgi:hypothetical protein
MLKIHKHQKTVGDKEENITHNVGKGNTIQVQHIKIKIAEDIGQIADAVLKPEGDERIIQYQKNEDCQKGRNDFFMHPCILTYDYAFNPCGSQEKSIYNKSRRFFCDFDNIKSFWKVNNGVTITTHTPMGLHKDVKPFQGLECSSLFVDGVEDHVHLLTRHSKNISVASFLRELKRESSKWIKTLDPALKKFHWQNEYGAFSLSPSHVEAVKEYIQNQEEYHRRETFQEEFRRICRKYGVEIDERYVWD